MTIRSNKDNKKKSSEIKEWIVCITLAFVISLAVKEFIIFKVYIPSESMYPTIKKQDQLFVLKMYELDNLKRGDIIVFESEELNELLIKRLIGLPGDEISIENGKVTINGEVIKENYVKNNDFNYTGKFKVPDDKYFFLGDNRSNSKDSRYWINPYIEGEKIIGKALIRVYPFKDFGTIK